MITYLFFLFSFFCTTVLTDLIQVETDLVNSVSPTGWSPYYSTRMTLTALEESMGGTLGPYDVSHPAARKTYGGSYPPHWSLSADVFAWQMKTWDPPDYCQLKLDNVVRATSYRVGSCALDYEGGAATNSDQLKIFHVNITHSAPSVLLEMYSGCDQADPDEYLAFNNIRIWIDTCDETCASCNGPAPNQCTSCPSGSSLAGGVCTCPGSLFASNYACVTCPANKWGDSNLKKCVPACIPGSNNCVTCIDQRHCGACSGGYVSYQGDCVTSCPWFYDNVGGVCSYLESQFTRGTTIYAGLDGIINQADESTFTFNFSKAYNLQQKFYVCSNGDRMLGGFDVAGSSNFIAYNPTVPYHWQVRIKVKVTYLDSWDTEWFYMKVNGIAQISELRAMSQNPTNYCGLSVASWNDARLDYDVTFAHSGSSLPISFETNLDEAATNESFGISHLIIVVDQCPNQLCTTCNATVCYTCVTGAFLNNSNICVNPCPNGQFGNTTTGRCEACSYKCTTCSGSATACTSCNSLRGASATLPNCDCQSNQYDNPPDPTCKQCSYKCATCSTSASNCTSCAANRPNTGTPGCACPAGTYDDGVNGLCPACSFVCSTCTGSAGNCLTCKGDRIRAPTCECPDGTFDDGVSTMCIPCNPKCRTCSGNANNCTSCISNRQMPNCDCPSTMYDDNTLICKACSYQCVTCTGTATNCTSCAGNRLPQIPSCPCPTGLNEAGYANCVICDPKCDQCTTVDKNCISCAGNRSQNPPFCSCPIGTYETNLANCPACSYKCSSCTITDSNCTSCSHVSRNTTPLCSCKDGYYEKGSIDCGVCPKKCITCQSATECVTCSANRWNPPQCSCKDGYYEDANGDCQLCNPNCTRCTGPGSTQCDTCAGNRISYPTCSCPLGTYDTGAVTCPTCNTVCTQCSGATSNDCISCSGNKSYDSTQKKCVCPANTLDLGAGYFCAQCNPLCNGCTGTANTCTTCAGNRLNLPQCDQCPAGTYDNGSITCPSCNLNLCTTCSSSSTNCSTCASGRINAPTCGCPIGSYDDGISCQKCSNMCAACDKTSLNCTQCVAGRNDAPTCSCDDGTYDDGINVICQKCPNKCVACSSATSCTSCKGDRLNTPNCSCPSGKFDDGQSTNCRDCDFVCNTCTGSKSNCTSCKGNRINFPSCVCPDGFFETGDLNCQPCDKQCATCQITSSNCLTCSGLRINSPVCSCPSQTYLDKSKNDCISCFKTCLTCNSYSSTTCLQCLPGFIMRDNECKGPIGTYLDQSTYTIKACLPTCSQCEDQATYCIQCDSSLNRILQNNSCVCANGYTENSSQQCVQITKPIINKCASENSGYGIYANAECECDDGYYLVINSGKCAACSIANCKRCTASKCLDCMDGYSFNTNGSCFRIITDQTPQIAFSIFCFFTLGFGITIGIVCFLKWQYRLFKAKGFQKLKNNTFYDSQKSKTQLNQQSYTVITNL